MGHLALDRPVEDNLRAWQDGALDVTLMAFGDDGAGDPFCVRLGGRSGEIVRWNYIDRAPDSNWPSMTIS